ncbi:MAG: Hsp33 family molecular chaperone HslO [Zoogloeaceae bacterium]|nr:Hsp33 family molecular chaperone HslO [Zoogloeaceae bacterium]
MRDDGVTRFLFPRLDIRGAAARLSGTWQKMQSGHDYPPAITRLLGELSVTAALIAAQLKTPGRLTLQLRGTGLVSLLLADCLPAEAENGTESQTCLALRGIARFEALPENAGQTRLLGVKKRGGAEGQLTLTLDLPESRLPYQSVVPLTGETLAEIFTHYLAQSEQQEARLFLAADAQNAAALFLQKMPDADQKDADGWTRLTSLAATARPEELLRLVPEELLRRLFPEDSAAREDAHGGEPGLLLFPARPVGWHNPDNREKLAALIRSWGRKEAETMLAEQGGEIVIRDEIGARAYRFDRAAVEEIFRVTVQ